MDASTANSGFYRLPQIIGNPKASPPIPGLIPMSKSKFYLLVKQGVFPRPLKISSRLSLWPVDQVQAVIDRIKNVREFDHAA